MFGLVAAVLLSSAAAAEPVIVTIAGTYEYVGAAPSLTTTDFTLSFTVERSPTICGGSPGSFLACDASAPRYTNGALDVFLGIPNVEFRDAGRGGGLTLFQQDLALNRLGFVLGSSVLFSGGLAAPTLLDGVFAITGAHCGGNPLLLSDLCSYAGQGFASGDPINNPFHDPITLQSDNPILSGTITIAAVVAVPEPAGFGLLGLGLAAIGRARRRR